MSKQSSVEWLFKQLWDEPKDKFTWYALLKKAKEMEKEQIIDAYHINPLETKWGNIGVDYYNETFKSE
jgi:hypothetical protein